MASNITWDRLTAAYGATQAGRRRHPPYTEASFSRAIGAGVDPAGHALHPAMPRFELPARRRHRARQLPQAPRYRPASGVTDSVIRIGTLVPADGPDAAAGRAAAAALSAYFDRLNAGGGVYGRRVELSDGVARGRHTRRRAGSSTRSFAIPRLWRWSAASPAAGLDATAIAAVEARNVPFIGPLTSVATPSAIARTTFYLLSGVEQQARALIDFDAARSGPGDTTVAIARSRALVPDDVAGRIAAACGDAGWQVRQLIVDGDGLTCRQRGRRSDARRAGTGAVPHGRPHDGAADRSDGRGRSRPRSSWCPARWRRTMCCACRRRRCRRTFVALPSVPADQSPAAREEYRALARDYHLPPADVAAQLAALGAAKVLIQGLKVAGRGLDRTTLVTAIETLGDFDTGLTPRLRFGRSARVGAAGAYIATLDLERKRLRPITDWLPVH